MYCNVIYEVISKVFGKKIGSFTSPNAYFLARWLCPRVTHTGQVVKKLFNPSVHAIRQHKTKLSFSWNGQAKI